MYHISWYHHKLTCGQWSVLDTLTKNNIRPFLHFVKVESRPDLTIKKQGQFTILVGILGCIYRFCISRLKENTVVSRILQNPNSNHSAIEFFFKKSSRSWLMAAYFPKWANLMVFVPPSHDWESCITNVLTRWSIATVSQWWLHCVNIRRGRDGPVRMSYF